ncbi:MAG: hypothetical protein M3P46_05650 [Actinomycetota bacterium]|nr:hypothetical protein [Actinomycetota bacterium]
MTRRSSVDRAGGLRVLRVVAAAALVVSAYVHVDLARRVYGFSAEQLTVGDLFLAQAGAATSAALALLLRPGWLTWALAALVGFGSLAPLVLTVYVAVPAVGPFPAIYEPGWYPAKTAAAVAAGLAGAAGTAGLLLTRRPTGRATATTRRAAA